MAGLRIGMTGVAGLTHLSGTEDNWESSQGGLGYQRP